MNDTPISSSTAASDSSIPPSKASQPRLHKGWEQKRFNSMIVMQRKESVPLSSMIALPPSFEPSTYSLLLDSIAEAEHPELFQKISTQRADTRKLWHGRKHPNALDPSAESHWYSDSKVSPCLWLLNSNMNAGVKPAAVQEEFRNEEFGFRGILALHDRPYILLVFKSPEHAELTWNTKNRTNGTAIRKEVLLEFARWPLPAEYAQLWNAQYGESRRRNGTSQSAQYSSQASSSNAESSRSSSSDHDINDGRPVLLDDWRDISGLVIIPNYLSEAQESTLIETLLGPMSETKEVSGSTISPSSSQASTLSQSKSKRPADSAPTSRVELAAHSNNHVHRETKVSDTPSENWIALSKRRVQHYGYAFNYLTNNVDPQRFLGSLPPFAVEVVNELSHQFNSAESSNGIYAQEYAQLKRALPNGTWNPDQLTINEYRPGQGIPHHIDTHSAFDEAIVSVSIMGDTVMEFCHPDGKIGRKKIFVPRRSLLALTGDARYLWTHGITPRATDSIDGTLVPRGTRISLTYRTVKPKPSCNCNYPPQCDLWRSGARKHESRIEQEHVHAVYDSIAHHFDKTRYKPWPRIVNFLNDLRKDCGGQVPLICDVGCGNGRYMGSDVYHSSRSSENDSSNASFASQEGSVYGPSESGEHYFNLHRVGGDRSGELVRICRQKDYEVAQFDCLNLPFRSAYFDAAMCIAVLHHLSTAEHRVQAIEELVRITKVGGKIAIFVWALDQTPDASSAEGSEEAEISKTIGRKFGQQDIFVPWTIESKSVTPSSQQDSSSAPVTLHRYLHVYRARELSELVDAINKQRRCIEILEDGIDHGNCFIFLRRIA